MVKFLSAILIVLLGSIVVAHGQETAATKFSDNYMAGIVEAVLEAELKNQQSVLDFTQIRQVSSENIEFIEPSKVSKLGFRLVAAIDLNESKKEWVVEYLRFEKISWRGDVAVVVLSRIKEGRPCFSAPFSHTQRYRYEVQQTPFGWAAQLKLRPTPWARWVIKGSFPMQ